MLEEDSANRWANASDDPGGTEKPPAVTATSTADPPSTQNNEDDEQPAAKRRKEEKERSRVSRACDRCKKKKTRCTGKCPCSLCLRAGLPCEYTAAYTRGRLPSVIVDEAAMASTVRPRMSVQPQASASDTSAHESPNSFMHVLRAPSTPATDPQVGNDNFARDKIMTPGERLSKDPSSRVSPEPAQTDQEGHYIGASSAVSFLLRIQRTLHQNSEASHASSIFTFGDAPLPDFDPTFFVLPPKAEAQRLVERYFDFAAPTHRFLHRVTVERDLDEFYETNGAMKEKEEAPARTAVLLMVLAQAQAYVPPSGPDAVDASPRYFIAAEHQLTKERGAVRLTSVQARLGQCFYLLTQSRINHAWSLFGTTAHLALALGLNRATRRDPSAPIDYLDYECRKRVFWSLYTLDKYLAAALGRPRTFKDEDVDQELPTVLNDVDLTPTSIRPSPYKAPSVMMASVEQTKLESPLRIMIDVTDNIRLARIVSAVLRDLYPIRPPSMSLRIELAAKYMKDLRDWRANNTRFLDADVVDTSLLIPVYQRQRNVLNLAYWHAVLLVQRPFLLSNFATLAQYDSRNGNDRSIDTSHNIAECLDAAMSIVTLTNELFHGNQVFRPFWFTQYYAFCAVVVLYIYRIQQHFIEPGKCEGYFAAGQRCQAQLSSISETDCLSKRYTLVLEELRLEAVRQTSHQPRQPSAASEVSHFMTNRAQTDALNPTTTTTSSLTVPPSSTPLSNPSDASFGTAFNYGGNIPPTPESAVFNMNLNGSLMADFASWGQFDSLASGGIGNMDLFPADNGFAYGRW